MKILIATLFFLFGCQSEEPLVTDYGVFPGYYKNFDREFHLFVSEFEADAASNLTSYDASDVNSIEIVDGPFQGFTEQQNKTIVGVCYTYSNGATSVEIKKSYWQKITDSEKKFLIYHELGHCVLNRGHKNAWQNWSCGTAKSIMGSDVQRREVINLCWNSMVEELFNEEVVGLWHQDDCFIDKNNLKTCWIKE